MTRFTTSIPATYFDDMYAADPDPWRFAASRYERDKYDATLNALPKDRYASALEIGCSIGVLTLQLAQRCYKLLALDVAEAALSRAALRCTDCPNTTFALTKVPGEWPLGRFDLILLSEVIYYLDQGDVDLLADRVAGAIHPGGDILLVHWLGETHYPLTGDEAAEGFMRSLGTSMRVSYQTRTPAYRLDVLRASAG